MTMSAPSAARRRAMLRPMRFAAPVIRATWPSSGLVGILGVLRLCEVYVNIFFSDSGMRGRSSRDARPGFARPTATQFTGALPIRDIEDEEELRAARIGTHFICGFDWEAG